MSQPISAERILLWLFVVLFGIQLGGGLYETLVIVPLWSASPPQSVWGWSALRNANPQFAIDSGRRFWIFVTPAVGLLAIAALLSGWRTPWEHRKWLIAATLTAFIMVIIAFVYFVPSLIELMNAPPNAANAAQIGAKARLWWMLNWVRVALLVAAWLCALRALQIPSYGIGNG